MKNKNTLIGIILGSIISIGTLIFLFVMFGNSSKEPDISISGTKLEISGSYGAAIELAGATAAMAELPEITRRNNGASIKNIHRGYYSISGFEDEVYLNISDKTAPCILITASDGKRFYINMATAEDTAALYNAISAITNNG